jgi:hypothetical protein
MQPVVAKKTSPWAWLLGGCLVVVVVGVAGLAVLWNYGKRRLAVAAESLTNPALRAEKAKRMLGAERLPEGYYADSTTFELPLLTHVLLSDRAPDAKGMVVGFDKSGFDFTESAYTASSKGMEGFFDGGAGAPAAVETPVGIRLRARETLGKGTLELGSQKIRYRIVRGRVEQGRSESEGLLTLMWIDCPGRKRERTAVWFGPEAASPSEGGEAGLVGTVGDPRGIRELMAHFNLCGGK